MLKKVDLYLSEDNLKEGLNQLIHNLRPDWPESDVKQKIFTEGYTNRLIGLYLESNKNVMILVRIYGKGTELYVDREKEVRNMQFMHKSGLIPPVYCTFNNGICYGFSPGIVLNEELVRDPEISRLISEMMARMHTIRPQINGNEDIEDSTPEPSLLKELEKLLLLIPNDFEDKTIENFIINRDNLRKEVNFLEINLKKLLSPVVFCHNDLLLKNIIFASNERTVSFIDFEYTDYNFQAYDIANHFCEFAGVETFDPNLYPDKEFQVQWLRHYLIEWFKLNGRTVTDTTIDKEVESLYNQVNQFSMAPHFVWGVWALIQAKYSALDFNYFGYGILRLREYFRRKNIFFPEK